MTDPNTYYQHIEALNELGFNAMTKEECYSALDNIEEGLHHKLDLEMSLDFDWMKDGDYIEVLGLNGFYKFETINDEFTYSVSYVSYNSLSNGYFKKGLNPTK